jgi:NifU-like protein
VREEVEAALAELRPTLRADGGDCELLGVDGNRVLVRMRGNCAGCQLARVTVNGLQMRLIARLGRPLRVIPAME